MADVSGALLVYEGLLLFAGVAILGRDARTWRSILRVLVAGGCAIAILNVVRLLEVFLRSGEPSIDLLDIALRLRLSVGFADVNAAGSFFVLISFALLGLIWDRARRPLLWTVAMLVPLAGAWLTGSRTAAGTIALLMGGIGLWCLVAPRSTVARRLA
jgi:hypothetical protein